MKNPAFNLFATSRPALVLPIASSLMFSITMANGQINEMITGNNFGTAANWSLATPPTIEAGGYKDLLFSTSSNTLLHSGLSILARSYNVTNGTTYTIKSNRAVTDPPTATEFRAGATAATSPPSTFTNLVSGIDNDLVFLSNNSNLTVDPVNPIEGGPSPLFRLLLTTGNFNISQGSTLTIGMNVTGNGAIVINGNGTTILSGDRSGSGATTVNGGSLVISGTHTGNGAVTLTNGSVLIAGSRSGTGTTTVRNGTFEITGTNGGTSYTIQNSVDNPAGTAPVLKLSNLNALPTTAQITGSTSSLRSGSVNLAVAGSYSMGSYQRGTIAFNNSSGSPTTLTFTAPSAISGGSDGGRTFTNSSADLNIVFAETLDIGSTTNGTVNLNTTGTITVAGGILGSGSTRDLSKGSGGTLAVNGPSTYTGFTRISGGLLLLGHPTAIPGGIGATGGTSNLIFNTSTAVIGLTQASGDFLRTVGTGVDQVVANPTADSALTRSMGFAAFGVDRSVDLGDTIQLSSTSVAGRGLVLGHATATHKITIVNNIALNGTPRTILVNDGSAAVDGELSGVISSPGATLVKTGAGTLALTGTNTYGSTGGGTEVQAGVLMVDGDSLSDTSQLNINGGVVQSTGSEIVGTLFFGEVQQAAGTWGATGSGAANIDDTRFSGSGVINVAAGPSTGTGFDSWKTANSATGQTLADDHDNDGVDNGVEYFLGGPNGNTSGFTALPAVTNTAGTLSVIWVKNANYTGNYPADFLVQTSDTLGAWATAATSLTPNVPDTVYIDGNNVTYTFPTGTRKFARLQVTGP